MTNPIPLTAAKPIMIKVAAVDGELWRVLVENQEKLRVLVKAGLLDLDFGKVTLNVHDSQIQSVVVEKRVYQRKAA